MTTTATSKLTLAEFLELPETKPASEYIDGGIYQKPMPQGKHSTLKGSLVTAINAIGKSQKLVYAFPELRCTVERRSLVPDIAVLTWQRIPLNENGEIQNKILIYPDWVIEILSPEQTNALVTDKILFWLNQGTSLGWLVAPEERFVISFPAKQQPEVKQNDDLLPVLPILKDWQLTANELFSWLKF